MNTQLATTQSNVITQCVNKSIADDFIRRYQSSTKNALENILQMGEAVNEIYQRVKSDELDKSDLEYFCQSVHLDPKGSTFRKYKAIGENAYRFRQHLEKLPSTFSVLYEMATLSGDEFERFVIRSSFSKKITLDEFKKITRKTALQKNNHLFIKPLVSTPTSSVAKYLKKVNRVKLYIVRDLEEKDFDRVIEALTVFRNNGWIEFDDPEIIEYINETTSSDIDDDEKYFQVLAEQDVLEMRM